MAQHRALNKKEVKRIYELLAGKDFEILGLEDVSYYGYGGGGFKGASFEMHMGVLKNKENGRLVQFHAHKENGRVISISVLGQFGRVVQFNRGVLNSTREYESVPQEIRRELVRIY